MVVPACRRSLEVELVALGRVARKVDGVDSPKQSRAGGREKTSLTSKGWAMGNTAEDNLGEPPHPAGKLGQRHRQMAPF